jgi:DNA-binding NarL/FixJ family response regulator
LTVEQAPGTAAVGICDSHEFYLLGLERALRDSGLTIFATARRAETAVMLAEASRGAVVLIDMALEPVPNGALQTIDAVSKVGGIPIAVGVDGSPGRMLEALRAGATGYVTKDMPVRAFAEAIRAAGRGEAPLSRAMTTHLIAEFQQQARVAPMAELLPSDRRLTTREWEILERIADGKTNRAAAAELSISVETVRTHVSHILAKLESPNRSSAAAKYHQLRLARA